MEIPSPKQTTSRIQNYIGITKNNSSYNSVNEFFRRIAPQSIITKNISTPVSPSLLPYSFWDIPVSTGITLTNFNVIYAPSTNNVQVDWGDGSAPETIISQINLNHTFI